MGLRSPKTDAESRTRWFKRLTLAICVAGTAASAFAIAPESPSLAATVGLSLWLGYALLQMRLARKELDQVKAAVPGQPKKEPPATDKETGFVNASQFENDLRREIARGLRYGDRIALAVFDVKIVGFVPGPNTPRPPSPAPFIAEIIRKAVRETDVVARLDTTRFAVLMAESDHIGGEALISRVRTFMAMEPFARDASGKGIYVRAWAGCASWQPAYHDPALFLGAAFEDMEKTRPGYESMQAAFTGAVTEPATGWSKFKKGA